MELTFCELINSIEFQGNLLIRVWDDENNIYTVDCADYDDLSKEELEPLWDLPVTHIYPYSVLPYVAVVVELCLEG